MSKPEALRLADELERDKWHVPAVVMQAAADELRRQHGEIKSMQAERLRSERRLLDVKAQRDALLEALRSIADCCDEEHAARDYASRQAEIRGIARAAIAKTEGQ